MSCRKHVWSSDYHLLTIEYEPVNEFKSVFKDFTKVLNPILKIYATTGLSP